MDLNLWNKNGITYILYEWNTEIITMLKFPMPAIICYTSAWMAGSRNMDYYTPVLNA